MILKIILTKINTFQQTTITIMINKVEDNLRKTFKVGSSLTKLIERHAFGLIIT